MFAYICLYPFISQYSEMGFFLALRFCRLLPLYCRSTYIKWNQVRSSVVNKMSTVAVKRSLKRQVMSFTLFELSIRIVWVKVRKRLGFVWVEFLTPCKIIWYASITSKKSCTKQQFLSRLKVEKNLQKIPNKRVNFVPNISRRTFLTDNSWYRLLT